MDKKQFYEQIKEKITLTEAEFEKEYNSAIEELKERGVDKKDFEKFALVMVKAKLKKQLISPSKKFKGYIIGVNPNVALNRITDKVKDDSLLEYRRDADNAIEHKFVDSNGNPLWHVVEGINVPEWKIGNLITSKDYSETIILLAKQDEDKNYKITFLTLSGEKKNLEKPRYKEVEFMANIKNAEGNYILNQSINTEFKVLKDDEVDFPALARKHLKQNCIDVNNLEAWHDKNSSNFNRLVITKSSVINIIPSLDSNKSHIINIDTGDDLDNKSITCWLDSKEDINFSERTPEIYVIGSTNIKINAETNEVRQSINTYGIYVPKEWRIESPKEIKEENTDEIIDADNEKDKEDW
ncbi:MAG: hypothetical protein KKC77_19390 [Proteobacteria bacterium]|nr:hypothetical protein [Pseudomonadota bacterium]